MSKYSSWLKKNITTNLEGKTIVITGGNSGIGFASSLLCAEVKMNIIWGCRNLLKAEAAKQELLKQYPKTHLEVLQLDLADLSSIAKFAANLGQISAKIDYFYHNAGVYRLPKNYTKDGLDLTIGTNFFGTYFLEQKIEEYLIKTNQKTKIIFTTSLTSLFGKIREDDFLLEKKYQKAQAYFISKRMITQMFTKYAKENINPNFKYVLVHPGATYTPLIDKGYRNKVFQFLGRTFMRIFFHSPEKASLSTMLCFNENVENKLVCPRGLFHLSGYPKIIKPSRIVTKNYDLTMSRANQILETINKKD